MLLYVSITSCTGATLYRCLLVLRLYARLAVIRVYAGTTRGPRAATLFFTADGLISSCRYLPTLMVSFAPCCVGLYGVGIFGGRRPALQTCTTTCPLLMAYSDEGAFSPAR